jgi:16S rRNA (uracil1498-N3)-methyltransferase
MQLFYQPKLLVNTTQILNEEESRHCAQVLRLKSGDIINITNGNGSFFTAELIDVNHKKCVIAITQETTYPKENNYSLHLAIAPTKSMDRMEWFIEKAVEMGIDEITPLICARSERKEIKTERLMKVAISAMKQSLKCYLPKINEVILFNDFLAKPNLQQAFICFGEAHATSNLHEFNTSKNHNLFLVGPEGDFTPKEITTASQKGYKPLNLGSSRLRTETAAMHIVSIVNFKKMNLS